MSKSSTLSEIFDINQEALSYIDGIDYIVEELTTTPDGEYRKELETRRTEMFNHLKKLKERQEELENIIL